MSLSPFVSFQSRFVTYLLTFPQISIRSTKLPEGLVRTKNHKSVNNSGARKGENGSDRRQINRKHEENNCENIYVNNLFTYNMLIEATKMNTGDVELHTYQ
jgi:hypothetical protein